jgi:DNA (cytosine-5)-methyltransferase 1
VGQQIDAPASTITAKDHHALTTVTLGTVTTRDRFALVTVEGVEYAIADIGMRMLAAHELWRAQGFPSSIDVEGLTKTQQIQLCGNSVCPPVAEAIVRANFSGSAARRAA